MKIIVKPELLLPSKGYIDPSVMTYTIQAIAAVGIAIGAAVGIHFRRAKKKLAQKLNIDENKNKEVEADDIVVNEDDSEKQTTDDLVSNNENQ